MKDLSVSLGATALIQILTMVQGVLTARWLLPEGKGELTTVLLWPILLVALGSLGIQDAVAFAAANSDETETRRISASGLWLMLLMSVVLVGAGYLILPVVLSNHSAELIATSRLFLWYIPPTLLTASLVGILLGKLRLTQVNALRTSVYVVILTMMVTFYLLGRVSVLDFTVAFLTASWGAFLLAAAIVIKHRWVGWLTSFDTTKKLLMYGFKVHIGSLAGMLNLRLDQLLLSIFLPPSILGLYVVAVTVGAGANLVASTIAYWVAFPRLSNLPFGLVKTEVLARFMRVALLASLLSAGILFVAAPWLIAFFFGAAYGQSVGMARVLILAAIPLGCNAIFAAGFKSYDLPAISSRAEMLGLGVTALALLVLLPNFQALGAAWASLLSYCVTFVYMLTQSQRRLNVRPRELFLPRWEDWHYLKSLLARRELLGLSAQK